MAVKIVVHRICDRCAHSFDESTPKYGEALPVFPKRRVECLSIDDHDQDGKTHATTLFRFDDLCPECIRIVEGLIRRIKLEEDPPVSSKKNKKGSDSKAQSVAAPAEEVKDEVVVPPPAVESKVAESPTVSAATPASTEKKPADNQPY
jgi:hypothetical protein